MIDPYCRTIKAADYLLNGNPDVTDERISQCRPVRSSYTYGIKEFDDEEREFFEELV